MNAIYDFSTAWHTRHVPIWDALLPRFKPTKFLEIGSYEGRSACYLIDRFADKTPIELHCIDTWEGGVEHDKSVMGTVEARFDGNTKEAIKKAKHAVDLRKYKQQSHLALAEMLTFGQAGKFDVVYVDGSHEAADVLADAVLSFKLLRVDGLMIFDDYVWSRDLHHIENPLTMPKIAIDAFMNIYQNKMLMISDIPLHQLYALKTAP